MERDDLDVRREIARARAISAAPGRKQRTCPARSRSEACTARAATRLARSGSRADVTNPARQRSGSRQETPPPRAASSVADMTTRRRSPRASQACLRERDAEIRVHAALVELVEDDGPEITEERVLLQARGEDALGREEQPPSSARTGARSGRASRLRRRSSSPVRWRCGAPGCARRRAAAGGGSPGRRRRARAARGSFCRRPGPPSRPRRGTRGRARGSRESGRR